MRRRHILGMLSLSPFALAASRLPASRAIVKNLVKRWEQSRDYTLAVFDTMPAEEIEFSPSAEQLSFAQHFMHLGLINVFYMGILTDAKTYKDFYELIEADFIIEPPDGINLFQPDKLAGREGGANKTLVAAYVNETFDYVISSLEKVNDDMLTLGEDKEKPDFLSGHTNLDLIIRGESHTAHHRAQAVSYLRFNGIRPPGYTVNNKF